MHLNSRDYLPPMNPSNEGYISRKFRFGGNPQIETAALDLIGFTAKQH